MGVRLKAERLVEMKAIVSSRSSLRHFAVTCSILGLAAWAASHTQADVLFNNFGPGDTYYSGAAWTVGSAGGINASVAMFFDVSASTSYEFDGFALAAKYFSGTDGIRVSLCSDSGGLPGASLESFSLTPSSRGGVLTASSTLHTTLAAGGRYWLAAYGADLTTSAGWFFSPVDTRGAAHSQDLGASWVLHSPDPVGAFRISATVVPEPTTCQLGCVLALGGAMLLRRR